MTESCFQPRHCCQQPNLWTNADYTSPAVRGKSSSYMDNLLFNLSTFRWKYLETAQWTCMAISEIM